MAEKAMVSDVNDFRLCGHLAHAWHLFIPLLLFFQSIGKKEFVLPPVRVDAAVIHDVKLV